MSHVSAHLPAPLPLPEGLLAWTRGQSPAMWFEIACGIDFAAPEATIDLLLAAQWITRQAECCQATAVLILAKLVAAGLHVAAPPQMAPEAARVMVDHLHRRIAAGRFAAPRFRLGPVQEALVEAALGPLGALPLAEDRRRGGTERARPTHLFQGWRPVAAVPVLSLVA